MTPELLEGLDQVDWARFPVPAGCRTSAQDALRGLADPDGPHGKAGEDALWAFGCDHCGTYYPVVLGALPFLERILLRGKRKARGATLAVLDNLAYFSPDEEFPTVTRADGTTVSLGDQFVEELRKLHPTIDAIASRPDAAEDERRCARELSARIGELAGETR